MRRTWTHEELQTLIPFVEQRLATAEAEQEEQVRPLPALTKEECLEYLHRLLGQAEQRPLTQREAFLHGQLLSQFEQAVIAEALGKKGRLYVIPEAALERLQAEQQKEGK